MILKSLIELHKGMENNTGHNHARTISNTFKLNYNHEKYIQYCLEWGIPSLGFGDYIRTKRSIIKYPRGGSMA